MNKQSKSIKPVLRDVSNDQRDSRRQRTLKGGELVIEGGDSPVPCLIRDISEKGAKLEIKNPPEIEGSLFLHLHDGRSWLAEVMWQRAELMGVRFVDHSDPGEAEEAPADFERLILQRLNKIEQELAELKEAVARQQSG